MIALLISTGAADRTWKNEETPERVRLALGGFCPAVEPPTLALLFDAEKPAWKMRPVTAANMKQEIVFMTASGVALPGIDKIDPAVMVFNPPK
jgi:hypothetical protein